MPISIIIDKCHECKNKINMPVPCVVFRCKHIYHVSCLNKKDKNGNKEIIPSCPKCGPNKITVEEKLNKVNEVYKNINSIEELKNELSKHDNELDYIDELYGKGVVDFNLNK